MGTHPIFESDFDCLTEIMLSVFRRALLGNRKVSVVTGIAGYSKSSYEKLGMLVLGAEEEGNSYGNVGEDAFFLKKTLGPVDNYGVADGVGGWRTKGVDPSIFSGTLMLVCKEESQRVENQRELLAKAIDIMNAVHESGEKDLQGSSTAVLLSVNKEEDCVSLANLGDSGFVHIRAGKSKAEAKTRHITLIALINYQSNLKDLRAYLTILLMQMNMNFLSSRMMF